MAHDVAQVTMQSTSGGARTGRKVGLSTPWSSELSPSNRETQQPESQGLLLSPTLGDGLKGEGTQ